MSIYRGRCVVFISLFSQQVHIGLMSLTKTAYFIRGVFFQFTMRFEGTQQTQDVEAMLA